MTKVNGREVLIMLPEECHPCLILAKAIKRIQSKQPDIGLVPIIIACSRYTQKTIISGDFPGREFLFIERSPRVIDQFFKSGAKLIVTPEIQQVYGKKNTCPINKP